MKKYKKQDLINFGLFVGFEYNENVSEEDIEQMLKEYEEESKEL